MCVKCADGMCAMVSVLMECVNVNMLMECVLRFVGMCVKMSVLKERVSR